MPDPITCKCGKPIGDSIGSAFGQCQVCWERECADLWWDGIRRLGARAARGLAGIAMLILVCALCLLMGYVIYRIFSFDQSAVIGCVLLLVLGGAAITDGGREWPWE